MLTFLQKYFARSTDENYGRNIIIRWAEDYAVSNKKESCLVLDLGCGMGTDLINIRNTLTRHVPRHNVQLHGVESFDTYIQSAKKQGIDVHPIDIERSRLPFADHTVDIVVANQIMEHVKEVFWITSEVARVLKPGGLFLVGVPNLAAWHNRILLLFGIQPASINVNSAHVRGYTIPGLRGFLQHGNFFKVTGKAGANFYPFPPFVSRALARLLPSFAVTIFLRLERSIGPGTFLQALDEQTLETNYYRGPGL